MAPLGGSESGKPSAPGDTKGFHLALLGIDGIGKSTLAREITDAAAAAGLPACTASWRGVVEGELDHLVTPATRDSLRRLWAASFRQFFGQAIAADASIVMPETYEQLHELGGTGYLAATTLDSVDPLGVLGSFWVELAANTVLHFEVVRPLVADGYLVLEESFGYKHLVKLLLTVERAAERIDDAVGTASALCHAYFGRALRPDVGLFLSGDPRLALRWRQAQQGGVGTYEADVATSEDEDSRYLRFQGRAAERYADFARDFAWLTVEVVEGDRDDNRRRAAAVLARTPLGRILDLAERP